MAQNTVLAAGTTAGTSTDVVIAAGSSVTIGIFTTSANGLPGNDSVRVYVDTPSQDIPAFELTGNAPVRVVSGPCTVRAVRGITSVPVGVFTET